MDKGIFLAGNASALLSAVEVEVAKREDRYAVAAIPNRFFGQGKNPPVADTVQGAPSKETPDGESAGRETRVSLDWNPGSAVSARALVLAAENRLGRVDEAILVCSPARALCAAADLKPVDIEVLVSDHVKSWFFLARELIVGFKARGQGSLVLVYPENGGGNAGVLGLAASASFRALAQGLLASAADEPYLVQGFTGGEAGNDTAFANFIFRQLDDTRRRVNGKLHKYGKAGFFK
ncbi:MAG: hypothetical protein FWB79_02795 [Treponema sp.]|nr:hypothetical protein [Treponema sp.]